MTILDGLTKVMVTYRNPTSFMPSKFNHY